MNINVLNHQIKKYCKGLHFVSSLLLAGVFLFVACTENIDTSNRYTFIDETVLSYIEKQPELSEYVRLLDEVTVSDLSSSTVKQLLSARGHYTCFAPTNAAIQHYLDTLQLNGLVTSASWEGFKSAEARDSIKRVIVFNSIIDGGNTTSYSTANFPTEDRGEFVLANMNDRKLYVTRSKVNPDSIFINGVSPVDLKKRDIEAINGYVHEVNTVIAPSNNTLFDVFVDFDKEGKTQFSVMSRLILVCGLGDTLSKTRDEYWETLYLTNQIEAPQQPRESRLPEHRKYGFTIFAEPDRLWEQWIGKPEDAITASDVQDYLQGLGIYPGATVDENYKDENNLLNLFVTYHVLPFKMSHERLVVHWNELGYNKNARNQTLTIPVYEYYTCMGRRRLLKTFESAESHGIFLNRFPILRNGRGEYAPEHKNVNDNHESGQFRPLFGMALTPNENEGIMVPNISEGDEATVSCVNGYIHSIPQLLVCTDNICTQLQRERLRFDFVAMYPEFTNNDQRDLRDYVEQFYWGYPNNYSYFNDIEIKDGCRFYFLTGYNYAWRNYQGTELNITGRYDFTMKLPPVPKAGHYELRFAVQVVSNRGMCQIYFGDDPYNLPAAGIPLDMRMAGKNLYLKSGTLNGASTVGWEEDTEDPYYNDQIDKQMRSNGFMKAPNCFTQSYGSSTSCRSDEQVLRRIVVSEYLYPEKTYYLRFKNVLDAEYAECFMDYIEYCAKEVYDNPEESEDIW